MKVTIEIDTDRLHHLTLVADNGHRFTLMPCKDSLSFELLGNYDPEAIDKDNDFIETGSFDEMYQMLHEYFP